MTTGSWLCNNNTNRKKKQTKWTENEQNVINQIINHVTENNPSVNAFVLVLLHSPETPAPACWATEKILLQNILPSRLSWAAAGREEKAHVCKSECESCFHITDLWRSARFRHAAEAWTRSKLATLVRDASTSRYLRPIHIILWLSQFFM